MSMRLDDLLVLRSLAADLTSARAFILAGEVLVNDERKTHVGEKVAEDAHIRMRTASKYVSRGGLKLEGALDAFNIQVEGKSCVDFGASTGGFTDCLLQRGASHVSSVDVGYGQLAWKLQSDERVSVYDRVNVRTLNPSDIQAPYELAVADLSFIRLSAVYPSVFNSLTPGGYFVSLVKPQFEVQKDELDAKGVVRSVSAHQRVLEHVCCAALNVGFEVLDVCASPIKGPEGNREFFLYAKRPDALSDATAEDKGKPSAKEEENLLESELLANTQVPSRILERISCVVHESHE